MTPELLTVLILAVLAPCTVAYSIFLRRYDQHRGAAGNHASAEKGAAAAKAR